MTVNWLRFRQSSHSQNELETGVKMGFVKCGHCETIYSAQAF